MKRILFVHNSPTRFVQVDRDLLAECYTVTERYESRPRGLRPLSLWRAVRAHDLVFCWFASWHSFLPVLLARALGKPAVVVVGGYDTANLPAAGYGSQRGGLARLVARTVMRAATRLVTNSCAARREAIANAGADPRKIAVIYHGVLPLPGGTTEAREPLALTVGNIWRENLLRKGLLPFVQAATHLPDVRFVLVGRAYDSSIADLRRVAPPNVEFPGFLPDADLAALYARASVYVQASQHEGFGLSVAEAMSAGCIPVVTRAGALPEVVGAAGIYCASAEPGMLAAAIRAGLQAPGSLRVQARRRIVARFPLARRRASLQQLVQTLLAPGGIA